MRRIEHGLKKTLIGAGAIAGVGVVLCVGMEGYSRANWRVFRAAYLSVVESHSSAEQSHMKLLRECSEQSTKWSNELIDVVSLHGSQAIGERERERVRSIIKELTGQQALVIRDARRLRSSLIDANLTRMDLRQQMAGETCQTAKERSDGQR